MGSTTPRTMHEAEAGLARPGWPGAGAGLPRGSPPCGRCPRALILGLAGLAGALSKAGPSADRCWTGGNLWPQAPLIKGAARGHPGALAGTWTAACSQHRRQLPWQPSSCREGRSILPRARPQKASPAGLSGTVLGKLLSSANLQKMAWPQTCAEHSGHLTSTLPGSRCHSKMPQTAAWTAGAWLS